MRVKILIVVIFGFFFLVGCSKQYPKIPENTTLAITVNIKDMTVSFIDLEKEKLIGNWKMEKPYSGGLVLPDGDSLLLFGKQVETADVYSLKTGRFLKSWRTGKGFVEGLLLPNRKEIAFADQQRQSVRFFDLDGEEIEEVANISNPLDVLTTSQEDKLIVVSYNSKKLTVIDLIGMKTLFQFPIHSSATGSILNEEKNEIWIGGHGSGSLLESYIHVYDYTTGEIKNRISAPVMPINLLKSELNIFALSHGSNTLYKLSDEGKVVDKVKVGANPFEMTIFNGELIVAGYDSNNVSFLTSTSLSIRKQVKVGKGPFQLIIRESE